MNLNLAISNHKTGVCKCLQGMPEPEVVCKNESDCIAYSDYAKSTIDLLSAEYSEIDFHVETFYLKTGHLNRELNAAHYIIKSCEELASGNGQTSENQAGVFTGKLSQGKRK